MSSTSSSMFLSWMFLYEEFVQVFAFLLFKKWDLKKKIFVYLLHSVLAVAQGILIAACGILVPWRGIKPTWWILNHWTTREVPDLKKKKF